MDTLNNAITELFHRLEVSTGAGCRRTWIDEEKARTVADIVASGESVSAQFRRHGLSPQESFGWRDVRELAEEIFINAGDIVSAMRAAIKNY